MPGAIKFLLRPGIIFLVSTAMVFAGIFIGARKSKETPVQRALASVRRGEEIKLSYQPKEKFRYTYAFSRSIQIHGWGDKIPPIAFAGEIYFDIVRASSRGFEALVQDKIPGMNMGAPVALRIKLDASGKNLKIYSTAVSSEAEEQHIAMLKDLLAQWVFPFDGDTVGKYESSFEKISSTDTSWKKNKINYVASKQKVFPLIEQSEHFLTWDAQEFVPQLIQGKEQTRMGKNADSLRGESSYTIQFVSAEPSKDLNRNILAKLKDSDALDKIASTTRERAGAPLPDWSTVLAALRSIDKLSNSEQLKIFADVTKNLRARGDHVEELINFLREQNIISQGGQSALFKMVVGSLATVATHEAQVALLKIYQEPDCPVSGKGTILAALTTTQASLEPATRNFLADTMTNETNKDLSQGAAFALGSSMQNAPNDIAKAHALASIQDLWNQQFVNGNSMQDKLAILDVVGNSGQLDLLPQITGVINSGADTSLRAKAVFALRFMNREDAVQVLSSHINDSDPAIREAAVNAVQYSPNISAYTRPLQNCVSAEPVSRIQVVCQDILNTLADAN